MALLKGIAKMTIMLVRPSTASYRSINHTIAPEE